MKLAKRLGALLVCGVLALGLFTGCLGHFFPNVMTVDGKEITSGMYLLMQYNAYREAEGLREDTEKDVLKQQIEGQNATAWIRERAEELCKRYVAVERITTERGITLSQESRDSIDQTMSYYWPYLEESYRENGVSEATFRRVMANDSLAQQLFDELFNPTDGELTPPDEELMTRYGENNAHLRFLSLPLTDADGNMTPAPELIEAEAEKMLEDLRGGADFEDVAAEYLPGIYGILGREYVEGDTATAVTTSYLNYDSTSYPEDFRTRLREETIGTYGAYVGEAAILVYEKIDTFLSDEEFFEMKESVIDTLCAEDFEEWLSAQYEGYNVSKAFAAQWYYRPSRIVE